MPYNGSGTFSVYTPGTPYVTGTVISSTVANAVNSDFATGLSTALTKDGQTTATADIPFGGFAASNAVLRAPDGLVGTPSVTFKDDLDTGFYRIGANNVGLALGGVLRGNFAPASFKMPGVLTDGDSQSCLTGVATTLFTVSGFTGGALYLVYASVIGGGAANYTAQAFVLWDGSEPRIVSNNGLALTLTLSGDDVQATQTSGGTVNVNWFYVIVAPQ